MEDQIQLASRALAGASCAVALTGAGISTASGIPDFRGPQGVWRRVDPEKFNISYFIENPDEAWDLIREVFIPKGEVKPNKAHAALAELERAGVLCSVITQNIDGLHQAAGSKNVIEIHGNILRSYCMSCGTKFKTLDLISGRGAPRCSSCGGLVRPDIVFFGEPLGEPFEAAAGISSRSDVFLAVGTSLAVSPANLLPVYAKRAGSKLIIINQGSTELDHMADIRIEGRAEEALPRIAELVLRLR